MVMQNEKFDVEEVQITELLIAGVQQRGRYSECSQGFAQLGRKLGRHICGKPLLLHYDNEYSEDDADFEACMPVRKEVDVEGISIRRLPAGRCLSLMHVWALRGDRPLVRKSPASCGARWLFDRVADARNLS